MAYDEDTRALALVLGGESAAGAAREVDFGASTVCDWCARSGVDLRRGRRGGAADPRLGGRLLALVASGRGAEEAASLLGFSADAVRGLVREAAHGTPGKGCDVDEGSAGRAAGSATATGSPSR